MSGFWAAPVVVMLAGYLVAPRIIWRLTVAIESGGEPKHEPDSQHV